MKHTAKQSEHNRLKGDVMQDILKRAALGHTLYDIAMDHKVTEAQVRKWVIPILQKYKHQRKLWLDKLIAECRERQEHDSNSHNTP